MTAGTLTSRLIGDLESSKEGYHHTQTQTIPANVAVCRKGKALPSHMQAKVLVVPELHGLVYECERYHGFKASLRVDILFIKFPSQLEVEHTEE